MKNTPQIFIAEDNKADIFFLKRVLEKKMYNYIIFEEVEKSIDYFKEVVKNNTLPKIVFLDIRLSDGWGFEILKYLKTQIELKNIPVIMMSSSDRKEDMEYALELGANEYVEKIRSFKKLKEELPKIIDSWIKKELEC